MPSNASGPDDQGELCISEITLQSAKTFKSTLKIVAPDGSMVHREEKKVESLQVTFAGLRNIPVVSGTTLQIEYRRPYRFGKTVNIKGAEFLCASIQDGEGRQAWTKTYKKIKITIRLANGSGEVPTSPLGASGQLRPTTDEILKVCPRFRILVLGKSGAGKSSLINGIFGVTDAIVSDYMPGAANIEKEILSKSNPRFILHDSQGFEGGETDTLAIVQNFIKSRGEMTEIKQKLHAIWVCVEIPTMKGRLMETGVEEFLRSAARGHLGNVPIVVVFTQYDKLVDTEKRAMKKEGVKATTQGAEERANTKMEEECVVPLKALVGENIPYVTVSTDVFYHTTFTRLTDVTYEKVTGYIMEAGVLTGISQKINPGVKILTSIEVGKQKYWRGLVSKTVPGMTMENFLAVIHIDIIKVWDLEDKGNYLTCNDFKRLMLQTVQEAETRNPNEAIMMGAKIVGAVASIASLFAGPAMLIVLPITTTIAAAVWIYDVNRQTHDNLRRMMSYIISLTIVMQNLFWMQSILAAKLGSGDGAPDRLSAPIKRRLIIQALNLYLCAADREELLSQIRDYAERVNFITQRSDEIVKEITRLLHSTTISNEVAFKQQRDSGELDRSWGDEGDVPWPPSMSTSAM